jgi:hypothetical protein
VPSAWGRDPLRKDARMAVRSGVYIVPTDRWYIERAVWLIAGIVLLAATLLAAVTNPRWVLLVIATGDASVGVALTGFCLVGNVLYRLALKPAARAGRRRLAALVLDADGPLVSRTQNLSRCRHQHLGRIGALAGAQPLVAGIHRVRWYSNGVVCGNGVLHHGERSVLARRRTASGADVRRARCRGLRQRASCLSYGPARTRWNSRALCGFLRTGVPRARDSRRNFTRGDGTLDAHQW